MHYVGDAVAFVVADSRELAQDAAELIEVDYEDEEAIAGTAAALEEGAPLVWPELGTNRAFEMRIGDGKKTDAAFAKADHVTRVEFVNNRLVEQLSWSRARRSANGTPSEGRYVLTTSSQGVHGLRVGTCRRRIPYRAGEDAGHHARMSAAASAPRAFPTASTRWCWKRPSGWVRR